MACPQECLPKEQVVSAQYDSQGGTRSRRPQSHSICDPQGTPSGVQPMQMV